MLCVGRALHPIATCSLSNDVTTMEDYDYAGFWIRTAAALIDSFLLAIVVAIPLTLIYGSDYWTSEKLVMGFWDGVFYIVPVVITVWFWVKYLGTPGKIALRLRVVDANTGGPVSTARGICRYLGNSGSAIPLILVCVWVAVDKRKQGLDPKNEGN